MDAALLARCESILDSAKDGEGLVKNVHECLTLLESRGLLYKMALHPSMIGISPLNRDGSGVNAVDVHDLLSDILAAGFLEDRVSAIGVEVQSAAEVTWNVEFFKATHGMLGTFDPSAIKCLSLAGSHTNCVLRILSQEIQHEGDESICHDGRLNMELLRKKDESFYKAAQNGVTWKVITKEAAASLPHLMSMVQRMGNATLQRHEHELQLMRRLHGMWMLEATQHQHVDFMTIKKRVTTGKTVHHKSLPHLYTFGLKFGGGRIPFLLDETESFVRRHSPSTRSLGAEFWDKISQEVKGTNQFPRVKLAYAKEIAQAADVKRLLHKDLLSEVRTADGFMHQWRSLVEKLPEGTDLLRMPELSTALSLADIHLIGFVLKMPLEVKQYTSKEALAHDVVVIMRGICHRHIESPWEQHAMTVQSESGSSPSPKVTTMRELNPDGTVKDGLTLLQDAGFTIGSFCRRKSDGQSGQIAGGQAGKVQLKQIDGTLGKVVMDVFLSGDWVTYTPKPEPVLLKDILQYAPSKHPDLEKQRMQAMITLDMLELQAKHEANTMLSRLEMHLKPQKKVLAVSKIPKNKLIVVPCSLQVKSGTKLPDDCIEIMQPLAGVHFWSQPMLMLPKAEGDPGFANPAFMVQTTHDEEVGNMELSYIKSHRDSKVHLPVLKNPREIAEGESLFIYKPKVEKQVVPLDADSPNRPGKRLRTKGPGQ
ncbi:unnamed protein product [Symbiodinium sp. CCMP2592]|nr:unnamed protein product [Symbiodinium sp. CCMP2592]